MLIILALVSLIALMALHEFGHFIVAKAFKIKVEEFGIGYPPRIFGKKMGETIYSLNWIPFGAFVRIYGHEERLNEPRSFSTKPVWQRALVILGGVISFWIIAAIIMSVVINLGIPSVIKDSDVNYADAKVQIVEISKNSPAQKAGIQIGDVIVKIKDKGENVRNIDKVSEAQAIIKDNQGKEIVLTIKRGANLLDISVTPRTTYSLGEGSLGVGLVRTALKSYPWYKAPIGGITATYNLTIMTIDGWISTLKSLFMGQGVPQGVEVRGIVGIFDLFVQAGGMGLSYFLQFIAIISVSLAVLNILPIPALDGGWLLLLAIEKIKGKPINIRTERMINGIFFFLLIALMIFVTIKDIIRIF